jgi:enterochelin esterase family protein
MAEDFRMTFPADFPNVSYAEGTLAAPSLGAGRTMPYLVVLPPGYSDPANAGKRYAVAYMLHGAGGYRTEWVGYGYIEVARKMMGDGAIEPMIFVFPQGDLSYWVNHSDGSGNWNQYVADDVVKHIDANYRTIARADARALGGLSNGAVGALKIGFDRPDVFGVIGSHAPAIRTYEEALPFMRGEDWFGAQVDPISAVEQGKGRSGQKIMLDIGLRDDWVERGTTMHQVLQKAGIAHTWWTPDGAHDGFYWNYNADEYLTWYSQSLAHR